MAAWNGGTIGRGIAGGYVATDAALFHDKLMVVDRYLTIGGSANFDDRSFKLNDESNPNIPDRAFAAHMTEVIEADIKRSCEEQWRDRPWPRRVADWLSALGSSQL